MDKPFIIGEALVRHLIADQFPEWKDLPVNPVAFSGWDNRTFHLGDQMVVRMPSSLAYAGCVEKEQTWLPRLAPHLPLPIPVPVAIGKPMQGYPWKWSIYRWLEGESASLSKISNLSEFALSLAEFLIALEGIDAKGGPVAGIHSFHRGGSLSYYDAEVKRALGVLQDKIDIDQAKELWEKALLTRWKSPPVWVHGDISAGNLLVREGRLAAVIDFGQLCVGDPACDFTIAWTLFEANSREAFRRKLAIDSETWDRARAWTLWKALIVAAGFTNPNNFESSRCWSIIREVMADVF